jgi:hypothetical protein
LIVEQVHKGHDQIEVSRGGGLILKKDNS